MVGLAEYDKIEINEYLVAEAGFSSVDAAIGYRRHRSSTYWNEMQMTLLYTEAFFGRIAQFPGFGTTEDRVKMDAQKWVPRQQRLWTPPEQRERSVSELRESASSDQ